MMYNLTEMSINDVESSTKMSAANRQGLNIEYPTDYDKSLIGVPISLTFNQDRNDTTLKMIDVWSKYMHKVSKGIIFPRPKHSISNTFESSCSIYQFITEEDGETIKFYCRWVGCYPNEEPFSIKQHKRKRSTEDQLTVSFYAPFFDVMDPSIFLEFNNISKFSNANFDQDSNKTIKRYINSDVSKDYNLDDYFKESAAIVKENNKFKLIFYNSDDT